MKTHIQRPYRIGLDARFFRSETAGLGRYSRELITHLAHIDQYNEYTVFLTPKDMEEWDIVQANFIPFVVDASHYTLAEQTRFLTVLNKQKFDLVHFLNFNHPLLYRRPFITTLHDLTLYFFPSGRSKSSAVRRAAFKAIISHSVRAAARVIAISEHTAEDAEKHLHMPHAKMEVIYNGGADIVELPFGNKAMIQEYLKTREPYFLFLSEWRPYKGLVTLIDAFDLFKADTKQGHKLVLAGKHSKNVEEMMERIARSPFRDDIITPGFVPEDLLPSLYRNSVAFICASEYEGFGIPVLEAMAHQAPVIAADNSSIPEVVGSAGLLFPTRDSAALAERMKELIADPKLREALIEKGRQQLRKFSWAKMAEKTHRLYLNVLEKRH
jgi:glycosyltransferase involved in cell wall biosynthesis